MLNFLLQFFQSTPISSNSTIDQSRLQPTSFVHSRLKAALSIDPGYLTSVRPAGRRHRLWFFGKVVFDVLFDGAAVLGVQEVGLG